MLTDLMLFTQPILSVKHTVLDSKYSSLEVNILTDCFKYRGTLFNREKSASNFLIDDTVPQGTVSVRFCRAYVRRHNQRFDKVCP